MALELTEVCSTHFFKEIISPFQARKKGSIAESARSASLIIKLAGLFGNVKSSVKRNTVQRGIISQLLSRSICLEISCTLEICKMPYISSKGRVENGQVSLCSRLKNLSLPYIGYSFCQLLCLICLQRCLDQRQGNLQFAQCFSSFLHPSLQMSNEPEKVALSRVRVYTRASGVFRFFPSLLHLLLLTC